MGGSHAANSLFQITFLESALRTYADDINPYTQWHMRRAFRLGWETAENGLDDRQGQERVERLAKMPSPSTGHLDGGLLERVRIELAECLRFRRAEIEKAILACVHDVVPDPIRVDDAEYNVGMNATVTAIVDYGLMGIALGEEWAALVPPPAVAQVRRAVRNGVGVETVLRLYTASHAELWDFVMAEADRFPNEVLREVLKTQGRLMDRLMDSILAEHGREVERMRRSPQQHHVERVQRLLAGASGDLNGFDYEFDAWHLGVIARGAGAEKAVAGLAAVLGRRLLSISHGEETVWAWLGGQRSLAPSDVERLLSTDSGWPVEVSLAIGEPGHWIGGWRTTHRQAQEALRVSLRSLDRFTRFDDVALVAAALRNEEFAGWLIERYLSPLGGLGCAAATLRETLRAYFAANRNASSAAISLDVSRRTIRNRMAIIEKALGPRLFTHHAELELALRLAKLLERDPNNPLS